MELLILITTRVTWILLGTHVSRRLADERQLGGLIHGAAQLPAVAAVRGHGLGGCRGDNTTTTTQQHNNNTTHRGQHNNNTTHRGQHNTQGTTTTQHTGDNTTTTTHRGQHSISWGLYTSQGHISSVPPREALFCRRQRDTRHRLL